MNRDDILWTLARCRCNSGARLVFVTLALFADEDNHSVEVAAHDLATLLNFTERYVREALKCLAEAGVIKITPQQDEIGGQLANIYTILPLDGGVQ